MCQGSIFWGGRNRMVGAHYALVSIITYSESGGASASKRLLVSMHCSVHAFVHYTCFHPIMYPCPISKQDASEKMHPCQKMQLSNAPGPKHSAPPINTNQGSRLKASSTAPS